MKAVSALNNPPLHQRTRAASAHSEKQPPGAGSAQVSEPKLDQLSSENEQECVCEETKETRIGLDDER